MEVVKLNTYIVGTPEPHIGGMYWIFLSIETKCGITGIGEVYSASFHPEVVVNATEDVFERYLKGQDPHHVERLYRECYSSGFTQRPDLTMMGVLSGLEMACWDIIGKAANKPIYELIGGKVHDKLRSYTYLYPEDKNGVLNYEDPELGAESAVNFMEQGFSAIKFDPAGPYSVYSGHQISMSRLDHCENYCRKVREAVGDNCDILIGTHGQYHLDNQAQ
jgi:2-dehydro-3-deoxyphosphogalactonate aldolase